MIFFRSVEGAKQPRRPSAASRVNCLLFAGVFAALLRVRKPEPKEFRLRAGSRVLIVSTGGLGDSLLDSVAIRAVAAAFPGVEIHLLVHHKRPDIGRHNPFVHRVHLFHKGPVAFIALWLGLRRIGGWDAVLYLSAHDPESRCLGYLLNKDATAGLAWRSEMGGLCAHDLDGKELRRAHLARQALAVAEVTGARTAEARMVYEVCEADRRLMDQKWKESGGGGGHPIVFQLGGGGSAYRDWPVSHFVQLIQALHAEGVGPLVLLGGADHRKKADAVLAEIGGIPCRDFVGRLSLPGAAALIESARCIVTTDTGIMHLAFALGTPTVALLHPSPGESRVGPLAGRELHRCICLPKPAGYRRPEDAKMSDIDPKEVLAAVRSILEKSNP